MNKSTTPKQDDDTRWISPFHARMKTGAVGAAHVGRRLTDRQIDKYVDQGRLGSGLAHQIWLASLRKKRR